MEYFVFNCPVCGVKFDIKAENEDEAVNKIAAERMAHHEAEHPNVPLEEEASKEEIRAGIEKMEE